MLRQLDHAWRVLATGLAFAFVFGGGGLLALIAWPVGVFFPRTRKEKARWAIRGAFRFYIAMLQGLGLLRLSVKNGSRLGDGSGKIVIANHPSLLDVVILIALTPRAQCIVKHQLWNHVMLGRLMRVAGYIRNDLEPDKLVEACQSALGQGDSLIIFPEGTRSMPGSPLRFQRGFANLAALTRAPIQTVLITCDPPTLLKNEPWWRIPARRPEFLVAAGECLDESLYAGYQHRSIAVRKLVSWVENYYTDQLGAING